MYPRVVVLELLVGFGLAVVDFVRVVVVLEFCTGKVTVTVFVDGPTTQEQNF